MFWDFKLKYPDIKTSRVKIFKKLSLVLIVSTTTGNPF